MYIYIYIVTGVKKYIIHRSRIFFKNYNLPLGLTKIVEENLCHTKAKMQNLYLVTSTRL